MISKHNLPDDDITTACVLVLKEPEANYTAAVAGRGMPLLCVCVCVSLNTAAVREMRHL